MKIITESIPADRRVKEFRRILSGTRTQTIETQGVLIVLAVFTILATGIHFAEHQFPVIAFFFFVVVHGTAAAEVFHFHRKIFVPGDDNRVTMTLAGFVDGIGKDLKYRMLAAFQVI